MCHACLRLYYLATAPPLTSHLRWAEKQTMKYGKLIHRVIFFLGHVQRGVQFITIVCLGGSIMDKLSSMLCWRNWNRLVKEWAISLWKIWEFCEVAGDRPVINHLTAAQDLEAVGGGRAGREGEELCLLALIPKEPISHRSSAKATWGVHATTDSGAISDSMTATSCCPGRNDSYVRKS